MIEGNSTVLSGSIRILQLLPLFVGVLWQKGVEVQ